IGPGASLTVIGNPNSWSSSTFVGPYASAIDPSGRFLYVTDTDSNTVYAFTIDPVKGGLTLITGSPFTGPTGNGFNGFAEPRSVEVDPSGQFLYIVNDALDGTV